MHVADGTYIDPDGDEDPDQPSFQRVNLDEGGVAYPAATEKIAYYACVVLFLVGHVRLGRGGNHHFNLLVVPDITVSELLPVRQ